MSRDNFNLIELYERYSDRLDRFGILHFPGLLNKVMGEQGFQHFVGALPPSQPVSKEPIWDTVIRARGLSMLPDIVVDTQHPMSWHAFRQECHHYETSMAHPHESNQGSKPSSTDDEAWIPKAVQSYWATINDSYRSLILDTESMDQDVGTPRITSHFRSIYGLCMDQDRHGRHFGLGAHFEPTEWCQHDQRFAGTRNLVAGLEAMQGIASPSTYWYGGSLLTSFAHHFEDFWLPSVNFHYWGAPKYWIGVPQKETKRVWQAIETCSKRVGCRVAEKRLLISPLILEHEANITHVHAVYQRPGDVVISASGATHGGCNLGLNLAEAVNFSDRHGRDGWLDLWDDMVEFYVDRLGKSIPYPLQRLQVHR